MNTHQYKMADLVKLTGVNREAIRFYISSGLLPPAAKTSRNMAWYNDTHVQLLQSIRTLQHEQFLPLKAIKSVLHGADDYEFSERQVKVISKLRGKLSANGKGAAGDSLRVHSPVPESDVAELQKLGWISGPNEELTSDDREIVDLWGKLRDNGLAKLPGISPKNINYVLEAVDVMVDRELEFFREHLSGLDSKSALEFVQGGHMIANRLFALLHSRRIAMLGKRLADRQLAKTVKKSSGRAGKAAGKKAISRESARAK